MKNGFIQKYLVWYLHGEIEVQHGSDNAILDISHSSDKDDHAHFN